LAQKGDIPKMIINSLAVTMVAVILALLASLAGYPTIGLVLLIISIAFVSIGSVTMFFANRKVKEEDE
jgi:uncharacterized membrane protein YdfJ with MMPL/SSD domain